LADWGQCVEPETLERFKSEGLGYQFVARDLPADNKKGPALEIYVQCWIIQSAEYEFNKILDLYMFDVPVLRRI
jgi:hypothetical protein